jgi:hypothetical protein
MEQKGDVAVEKSFLKQTPMKPDIIASSISSNQ